ncbi:MAG TPA: vitamin K epoxide reductase family protein [Candidatus Limnocylindrales bacterium]|nr:vitamin K epoxide reductase family protein [Candidatus Limnocylindrales bacterium]
MLGLALAGLAISAYLASFQLGWIGSVWDPLFGNGSERVLTSRVSDLLPVPDAAVGSAGYAVDAVLAGFIWADPGRDRLSVLLAVVAIAGAVVGIGLAFSQALVVGAFCTLCLASTAISVGLAWTAVGDALDRRAHGADELKESEVGR